MCALYAHLTAQEPSQAALEVTKFHARLSLAIAQLWERKRSAVNAWCVLGTLLVNR
jgi:hypothetical protein